MSLWIAYWPVDSNYLRVDRLVLDRVIESVALPHIPLDGGLPMNEPMPVFDLFIPFGCQPFKRFPLYHGKHQRRGNETKQDLLLWRCYCRSKEASITRRKARHWCCAGNESKGGQRGATGSRKAAKLQVIRLCQFLHRGRNN